MAFDLLFLKDLSGPIADPEVPEWDGATPQEAIDLIHNFERLHRLNKETGLIEAYHDPVGFPTQGWGSLLSRHAWEDLSKYPAWTREEADARFRRDLSKFEDAVRRLCPVALHPYQFGALVSFTYNLGPGNLQISTLRKKVNRGEFHACPYEFTRWTRAGGVKLAGLVRRRDAEAELFALGTDLREG